MLTQLAAYLPQKVAIAGLRFWMMSKNVLKYGDPNFFQQCFIEINSHCNRRCPYCPNVSVPQLEQFMPLPFFRVILHRLQEIDWAGPVSYHCLSEPLLHPDIIQFVKTTKEMLPKATPIMFTNGDFLTMDLAGRLVGAGIKRCSVTNHPPLKEGWMERVMQVCTNYPHVFRYQKLTAPNIFKSGSYTKWKPKTKPHCVAPRLLLPIRINGDYGLCHSDPLNLHSTGNVLTMGIMEMWNNANRKSNQRRLAAGHRDFEICKECDGLT